MRFGAFCVAIIAVLAGAPATTGAFPAQSGAADPARKQQPWRAGVIKGLTVGVSTRADMIRLLGAPTSQWVYDAMEEEDPRSVTHFIYKDAAELSGDLSVDVVTGTGRITAVAIEPDLLTLERAIEHFGSDYVRTRYEWCPGGSDDVWIHDGPIYEAPDGSMEYIEYRDRGIAILVGYSGLVNEVWFVGIDGVGFRSTKECVDQLEKDRRSAGSSLR
jgi:hypothetical protein